MKKLLILIAFLLVPLSASAQVSGVRVCSFPNCGLVSPADLVSSTLFYKLDGSQTPTADQPMGAFKIQLTPTCNTYSFSAGTTPTLGPYYLYGHLMKFAIDGYAGNAATTGATASVQGCTTFPDASAVCSSDLVNGTNSTAIFDGTSGNDGFIVDSPQTVTVNILSAAHDGTIDICQF